MKLLKFAPVAQDLESLNNLLVGKEYKSIIFAGLDIEGNVITHFLGNELFDWCALLKFIERRIDKAMTQEFE